MRPDRVADRSLWLGYARLVAGNGSGESFGDGEPPTPIDPLNDGKKAEKAAARLQQQAEIGRLADREKAEEWRTRALSAPIAPAAPAPATQPTTLELLQRDVAVAAVPGYWQSLAQNATTWAQEATVSEFWAKARAAIETARTEYTQRTGSPLTPAVGLPDFTGKGLPRLKEKVLREIERNTLANVFIGERARVPRINDLVRVRVKASYLDGVDVISEHLAASLRDSGLTVKMERQERLRGYYATHLSFDRSFLFRFMGEEVASVACEIQVATELSSTIWERTHGTYEVARNLDSGDTTWMWNPDDPRFIAAQLAHMIHLADGLIVQLREKTKAQKGRLK